MSTRKVLLICLLSNLSLLAVLAVVFNLAQSVQAHGSNGNSAPSAAMAGPYYYTLSSMDFNAYDDAYTSFTRDGLALKRTSNANPSIAVAPVHLPVSANVRELLLDASDTSSAGDVTIRLQSCPIGSSGCSARVVITSNNSGRQQLTTALDFTVDNQAEALFIQAEFNGANPSSDVALYFVRIGYFLPSPIYLPTLQKP